MRGIKWKPCDLKGTGKGLKTVKTELTVEWAFLFKLCNRSKLAMLIAKPVENTSFFINVDRT